MLSEGHSTSYNRAMTDKQKRSMQTNALLQRIQAATDLKVKQELAWQVVQLNDAASTWLARRFCPQPTEDDTAEARLALYDAALYCKPDGGSSYISVACWYYMRRTTGRRNAAGIHVPTNLAHLTSKVRKWMTLEEQCTGRRPTYADAVKTFKLHVTADTLQVVMNVVLGNAHPNGNPQQRSVLDEVWVSPEESLSRDSVQGLEEAYTEHDRKCLQAALARLTPLERRAVLSYSRDVDSLRAIGEEFGVSREWVNQIRRRVLAQLRLTLRVPNALQLNEALCGR